jgi:formylglycine-generating enzyme required for sulfatase activity
MMSMLRSGANAALLQDDIGRVRPTIRNDMVFVPGGTFRMGSDRHYPEEAPAHRVTVDGFWIDRVPVTNKQFREFADATAHISFAEIPPDPKHYPGALPHVLRANFITGELPIRTGLTTVGQAGGPDARRRQRTNASGIHRGDVGDGVQGDIQ